MNQQAPKRSNRQYLTDAEIATLKEFFLADKHYGAAAREVNCSGRVAAKYFAQFRGNAPRRRKERQIKKPAEVIAQAAPRPKASRFYVGNFELSPGKGSEAR